MGLSVDYGPERLEENIAAADIELTVDDSDEIENTAAMILIQGARYLEHLERLRYG